jgi:hypothetical protein
VGVVWVQVVVTVSTQQFLRTGEDRDTRIVVELRKRCDLTLTILWGWKGQWGLKTSGFLGNKLLLKGRAHKTLNNLELKTRGSTVVPISLPVKTQIANLFTQRFLILYESFFSLIFALSLILFFTSFVQHPVSWRPNTDGTKLIGHMLLKKDLRDNTGSSAHILGLKVTGGVVMDPKTGRFGAIVEKVKEGSIADIVGRLRPGDEIIEWNGR